MLRPLLDILYPRTCLSCAVLLSRQEADLCEACRRAIDRVDQGSAEAVATLQKITTGGMISDVVCLHVFTEESPLRPLIHALKYRGFSNIGRRLGLELGTIVVARNLRADLVVPIPLSRQKERQRGFNQASRIAEGVSQATGIPRRERLVLRLRNTDSQTTLTHDQRRQNVLQAFGLSPSGSRRISGKRCLLIDDVITTGSTILECASVLRKGGAADIVACAVAIARRSVQ